MHELSLSSLVNVENCNFASHMKSGSSLNKMFSSFPFFVLSSYTTSGVGWLAPPMIWVFLAQRSVMQSVMYGDDNTPTLS